LVAVRSPKHEDSEGALPHHLLVSSGPLLRYETITTNPKFFIHYLAHDESCCCAESLNIRGDRKALLSLNFHLTIEGPIEHAAPEYAQVPGIRIFGMMCVTGPLRRGKNTIPGQKEG
jgi:hypothetical protein